MAEKKKSDLMLAANAQWRSVKQASHRLRQAIAAEPTREPLLREAFVLGFMGGGALAGQIAAAMQESLGQQKDAELTRVFGPTPESAPKAITQSREQHAHESPDHLGTLR